MYNDDTVELIFTPDGDIRNVVYIEELVAVAPTIKGWKFTALKPALSIENVNIGMAGYSFNAENMFFYSIEEEAYPDEIDIVIIHNDYTPLNSETITTGTYIFLDNFLGELNFMTTIDELNVIGKKDVEKELIPMHKLMEFINWRQKEFIEKYQGFRQKTEEDNYAGLTAELENGNNLIAILNTDLLKWENKASHPWIMHIEIKYEEGKNGMSDEKTQNLLDTIEEEIMEELIDFEGYLNVGRQTSENVREIYFACKDFRKPSKVLHNLQKRTYEKLVIEFDIYKDKYWRTFDRFGIQ